MPEERTFSESEHNALLQSAIEREVASAVESRDGRISELEQQVDVLEAEKASAEQRAQDAESAHEAYKAEVEQAREIEARKTERVERIKAAAIHLPDGYFTPERAQRWAEMSDEQFAALVEDFEGAALAGLSTEEAAELNGLQGEERQAKLTELRSRRLERAGEERETAAFSGGQAPSSPDNSGQSVVGDFFRARRGEPVSAGK